MKAVVPIRPHKCYAFVSSQIELEREPTWIIDDKKKRISLYRTIYVGIYGFSAVDIRDKFVAQCNSSGHNEVAFVCQLIRGEPS